VDDAAASLASLEQAVRSHLMANVDELAHWIADTLVAITVEARSGSNGAVAAARQQTPAPRLCRSCRQRLASQGRHYCRRCRRRAAEEHAAVLAGERGPRAREFAEGARVSSGKALGFEP
jgi:hypothetical protein